MKLVNKKFHQIINGNVRIKDLVISDCGHLPCNRRWFYTYDLISLRHLIKYEFVDNVYLNLNKPILSQLKQLFIYWTTISLETLNALDRLVHLEIVSSNIKCITDNNVLSLPKWSNIVFTWIIIHDLVIFNYNWI